MRRPTVLRLLPQLVFPVKTYLNHWQFFFSFNSDTLKPIESLDRSRAIQLLIAHSKLELKFQLKNVPRSLLHRRQEGTPPPTQTLFSVPLQKTRQNFILFLNVDDKLDVVVVVTTDSQLTWHDFSRRLSTAKTTTTATFFQDPTLQNFLRP